MYMQVKKCRNGGTRSWQRLAAGFWKWSRHPNYFFEMLVWWGLFVVATQTMGVVQLVAVCSPLLVTVILLFVSGVPVVEAAADAKYGKYVETLTSLAFKAVFAPN